MPPKSFYEVDTKTYLFGKSETPEEKVRQWVIFELISNYGFNINNIQVEVPCKVGSKSILADIVVYKEKDPLILVECKRQEERNHEEALKQAESYANFLKTDFLVFTNGISWIVKRKVQGLWEITIDIPSYKSVVFKRTITETIRFVETVKPLLYWMYRSVPQEHARTYFEKLLYFFQSDIFVNEMLAEMKVRQSLFITVEMLLCVLGAGTLKTVEVFDEDAYKINKMHEAIFSFETYLESIGYKLINKHKNFDGYLFQELLGMFIDIPNLIKSPKGVTNNELLLLRLTRALNTYLWKLYEKRDYIGIEEHLIREVEMFLNEVLKLELNSELPDSLDTDECKIMKAYSSEKWLLK